ncbi:LysR substrate-binding domain-containing protein [Streptomyces olivaceoviridis]|uniref:LysR substrate-binding domain-containing protein n=1 Tax=Streptomyces olivaceoviridis TaxID=1921 RepID=A0ABW7VEG6_STROI|nr:LysR substrate-binding domain-containing protein [Streptomyces corchorusii]
METASLASLDLNLLRTFLAVYRSGSFTGAARLLGLSQPTVTTQMRALERQTGRELFERLPRGVTPTPVADELAARIAAPLDELAAVAGPTPRAGTRAEPVHLAGPAELLCTRALPALAPLIAEGVRLRVATGLTDPLLDELRAGRHDLVIATTRPRGRTVHAVPLTDEEFVLVAAPIWAERLLGRGPARENEGEGAAGRKTEGRGVVERDTDTDGVVVPETEDEIHGQGPAGQGAEGPGSAKPGGEGPGSAGRQGSAGRGAEGQGPAGRGGEGQGSAGRGAEYQGPTGQATEAPGPAVRHAGRRSFVAPDSFDPAVLHEVPLITYAEDLPIARRYWRHVFGRRLSRTAAVTVPDLRGVLAAVAAGAGFSVLPRYLCQDLLASGALVALLEPEDPPINTGFLVQRPGASDNPDVARVRALLLRAARRW